MTMPTWVTQLVSYSPFLAFVALATAIAYPHNRLINRWLWLAPIVLLILIQLVPAGIVIAYKLVTPDAERDILITRQLVEAMRGAASVWLLTTAIIVGTVVYKKYRGVLTAAEMQTVAVAVVISQIAFVAADRIS